MFAAIIWMDIFANERIYFKEHTRTDLRNGNNDRVWKTKFKFRRKWI